jgi:hypothetical protein
MKLKQITLIFLIFFGSQCHINKHKNKLLPVEMTGNWGILSISGVGHPPNIGLSFYDDGTGSCLTADSLSTNCPFKYFFAENNKFILQRQTNCYSCQIPFGDYFNYTVEKEEYNHKSYLVMNLSRSGLTIRIAKLISKNQLK